MLSDRVLTGKAASAAGNSYGAIAIKAIAHIILRSVFIGGVEEDR
jgi:hypothetical protein